WMWSLPTSAGLARSGRRSTNGCLSSWTPATCSSSGVTWLTDPRQTTPASPEPASTPPTIWSPMVPTSARGTTPTGERTSHQTM
ncbi:hypothetical protein LTR53_019412, partial [Teratosphaeriaceae sp. CCFEE 6253]